MQKRPFIAATLVILLGQGCFSPTVPTTPNAPRPSTPTPTSTTAAPTPDLEVIATGLDTPWDIAFLPAGDMIVTERPGKLTGIASDGTHVPFTGLDKDVNEHGEGGLLGMALHPNYASNHYIYLYFTAGTSADLTCRVIRFKTNGTTLSERTVILDGIPGAVYHDGGRIAFGPDGKLYVTTGDATQDRIAQDKASLGGKILRVNDDGSIPSDNPFGTAVWSYGHRNPQGLAWDDQGRLWATEHGRSGVLSGFDELNLIEKGNNYGWPTIQGSEKKADMITPVLNSGATETWAPSGAAFVDGSVYFSGLRGETLYQAQVGQTPVALTKHLVGTYGRLRAVVRGPDGMLYISTSNRDGRGSPAKDDDKIIRVNPSMLK